MKQDRRYRYIRPRSHPPSRTTKVRDIYDWLTLWVAIIAMIAVALSTAFSSFQAYLTGQQFRLAAAQQRAWLRAEDDVELVISSGEPSISHGTPAVALAQIGVVNLGSSPAMDSTAILRLIGRERFPDVQTTEGYGCMPPPDRQSFRKMIANQTVYPNQSARLVALAQINDASLLRSQGSFFGVVCIYYTTGLDASPRVSAHLVSVGTVEGNNFPQRVQATRSALNSDFAN